MATDQTLAALTAASAGLTYQSETDAPWSPFLWPDAQGEPNGAGVLRWGKHKAGEHTAEENVDAFFKPLTENQDWFGDEERAVAAKYRALFDTVKQTLGHAKVIRVGRREIAIYVVGLAERGWAGLRTDSVET